MNELSRRRFLADAAGLLAVSAIPAAAAPILVGPSRRVSPNDKLRIACIGFNGRGMNHIEAYVGMDDVEITALCDADTATFGKALRTIEKAGKPAPKTYQDVRKLLESKEIDAVSIATPNHWHSLCGIWAMQAGFDVYCEKPVSHNVMEGRRLVETARKFNKICQCGTQSRSSVGLRNAMAYLHSGELGKISIARGLCYKRRKSIGKVSTATTPPATVDYDIWTGPAPLKPLMRANLHYDWHWVFDTGNGDVGNQGIHEMDKARWGLGKAGFPKHVMAMGGRFGYVDDANTPNSLCVFHDYGDSQLIFEVRGLETPKLTPGKAGMGAAVGNIFYGEKGIMVMPSYSDATVYDNDGNKVREFKGGGDHFRNFVDAVKSRKRESLHAEIEEGHLSSALCHLGNISYLMGEKQPFSKKTKAFGDNKEAYETIGRMEEHLTVNGINLSETDYMLGKKLTVVDGTEHFTDKKANILLTREYRKGFEVPSKV
ncbi:MAG: Gfo/Idh/MocA family oxidoreductase [Chthonomonadales bacterium]